MTKQKKRIWSKEELIIAYYISKWDLNGLNVSEDELVEAVIGRTTIPSLRMQVSNFRYLMNIEGQQLSHASEDMKELVGELQNTTVTNVRRMVLDYINLHIDKVRSVTNNKSNKIVAAKAKELNEQEELIHLNKLVSLRKYRRLRFLRSSKK